ncbi:MAG: hypothetical protein JNN11_03275 [Candidatus Doudnabacteria bacterium]|nr:hypothetical protein [Candidatus Doudnabacteria bacterium]
MQNSTQKQSEGYIVLGSVIILSAIGTVVSTALLLFSLNASNTNFSAQKSIQSRNLAAACAEQALDSLRQDPSYTGIENNALEEGSCEILGVEQSGSLYTIKTQGNADNTSGKILIQAERLTASSTNMQIISWLDVADF